jgi:hypothetical protein
MSNSTRPADSGLPRPQFSVGQPAPIIAADWRLHTQADPDFRAYHWDEIGAGSLRLVTGIRADWRIVTGMCSWCCTPCTTLYICPDDAARASLETSLRERLADRRRAWDSAGGVII